MFQSESFNLSRWYAGVSLVSIAVITVGCGWLASRFLTDRLLQQEGRLTQEFVQSIVRVEDAGDYFAGRRSASAQDLERVFEHIAQMPDVLRANLHSREQRILWSSDRALIGRSFPDNDELSEALGGRLVVNIEEDVKREHVALGSHTRQFIEIYAPVWDDARGEVIGVVELYKTPAALFEARRTAHVAAWVGALAAGAFLYFTLWGLVRRADALIRAQRERLVQSETLAAVGEMGSAVAHGIRNPLASIRSSAELALESDPSRWRAAAREIVEQVDRLESWVRELLSYSQPLAANLEPIQVGALVQESLRGFERDLARRGIHASARVDPALPAVAADPLLLGQVFNSLIANAVEAVARDGRIDVRVRLEGDRRLRVTIEDTGPGMTQAQVAGAFQPFHTTKTSGLGVGLPLARRVIERLGGSIQLASSPGAGTIVEVLLPSS